MIEPSEFFQEIWCLNSDVDRIMADSALTTIYNNLHIYAVLEDELFGIDGEIFLRIAYNKIKGEEKKTGIAKIRTDLFDFLRSDQNAEYVKLVNSISRGEGSALVEFEYIYEKRHAYYKVVRWEERKKIEEDAIEPDKTIKPNKGRHKKGRPDKKAAKRP